MTAYCPAEAFWCSSIVSTGPDSLFMSFEGGCNTSYMTYTKCIQPFCLEVANWNACFILVSLFCSAVYWPRCIYHTVRRRTTSLKIPRPSRAPRKVNLVWNYSTSQPWACHFNFHKVYSYDRWHHEISRTHVASNSSASYIAVRSSAPQLFM